MFVSSFWKIRLWKKNSSKYEILGNQNMHIKGSFGKHKRLKKIIIAQAWLLPTWKCQWKDIEVWYLDYFSLLCRNLE